MSCNAMHTSILEEMLCLQSLMLLWLGRILILEDYPPTKPTLAVNPARAHC